MPEMPLVVPPGVPSDGAWRVWFADNVANQTAPKMTEIAAASTLDASCLLTKGGVGLDNSYEKFKDERLCTVQVFEQNGAVTWTFNDLQFVIDPQEPTSATNKLYAKVLNGWDGFIIIRMGYRVGEVVVAGHRVWVVPVSVGIPVPLPPEANTNLRAKASVAITGIPQREVALVA